MKTQHYKVEVGFDVISRAYPGHFVFKDNDSDEVSGFVKNVNEDNITIMLFEPITLKDYMTNIDSECDYKPVLSEILRNVDEIRELWLDFGWEL